MCVRTCVCVCECVLLKNYLCTKFCSLNSVLSIDYGVESQLSFSLLVNLKNQDSEVVSLSTIEID
jgi:hypothetical protein